MAVALAVSADLCITVYLNSQISLTVPATSGNEI